jgi:hypothetical protein
MGVLAYFGYYQAHEDDAEKAVRAELKLVTAVNSPKSHAPTDTRWQATGLLLKFD